MNAYGFAGGDRINFSDPMGLSPHCDELGFCYDQGAILGAAIAGVFSTAEMGIQALGRMGKAAVEALSGVQANKARGDAFRDEVAGAFESNGYGVSKEVGKRTPFGRRVIDIEVSKNGEVLGGIETKTGGSRYTAAQRAKDAYLGKDGYPVQVVRDATAVKKTGTP